jgi:hypothetical protein
MHSSSVPHLVVLLRLLCTADSNSSIQMLKNHADVGLALECKVFSH